MAWNDGERGCWEAGNRRKIGSFLFTGRCDFCVSRCGYRKVAIAKTGSFGSFYYLSGDIFERERLAMTNSVIVFLPLKCLAARPFSPCSHSSFPFSFSDLVITWVSNGGMTWNRATGKSPEPAGRNAYAT